MKVCGEWGVFEWCIDGSFENKVVDYIVGGGIWSWRGKLENFDSLVIIGGSEEFIGWVKGDFFDMVLVNSKCF